jgi:hypothetical protein
MGWFLENRLIGKNVEGSDHGLYLEQLRKLMENNKVGTAADIRTGHLKPIFLANYHSEYISSLLSLV